MAQQRQAPKRLKRCQALRFAVMLTFRFGDARASYTDGTMPTTAV
jgi:hypothetical protein